jgi:hypothetical protein
MKVILWITTLCFVALLLPSCATNTVGGPTITLIDFSARNIEWLRAGIPHLVGDDSAGLAAMEYIEAFEEDLTTRIPTQAAMQAPIGNDPYVNTHVGGETDPARVWADDRSLNHISGEMTLPGTDPKILELKHWLDGRKVEAIGNLRAYSEAFVAGGGRTAAKMGLSAAYIAISCANERGDVETITKLVEPLLNELTKK